MNFTNYIEIKQQNKRNPPNSLPDQRAPLVSGRGFFPARQSTPRRAAAPRRRPSGLRRLAAARTAARGSGSVVGPARAQP